MNNVLAYGHRAGSHAGGGPAGREGTAVTPLIEADGLIKRFGTTAAPDGLDPGSRARAGPGGARPERRPPDAWAVPRRRRPTGHAADPRSRPEQQPSPRWV